MYLYQATSKSRPDGLPMKGPATYGAKIVNKEINASALLRDNLKDTTSSKLQIKGPKQADALQLTTTLQLRQQIASFSVELLELTRANYMLEQNDRRRSLQEFQCNFLIKLEHIVKMQIIERGEKYRKYQIGGYDGGTYERFFKIEPARYMSKAQLMTALRLTFGNDLMKSEVVIGKLFDSFDFNHTDKMDWRGFLILFAILMQPLLSFEELIRLSYALYSSFGYLDLNCIDPLSLGVLKAMLCAPVQLSLRNAVMNAFDNAWKELTEQDQKVLEYIAHKKQIENNAKNLNPNRDPEDFKIPFGIFQKLLKKTSFAYLLETKTVFGKRDTRSWTYVFEEEFYHPIILQQLKALRRMYRNEDEADKFIAQCAHRKKRILWMIWKMYIARRIGLRNVLIAAEIRSTMVNIGVFFDHWRKLVIEMIATQATQRVVRGFMARKRTRFMQRLQQKVIRIQKHTRQALRRQQTNRAKTRLYCAAVTIQRNFRGRFQRKRIVTMIEAVFDTQKRLLAKEKQHWFELRRFRAAVRVQMCIRRFLRRRRVMKHMYALEQHDRVLSMMEEQRQKNALMIKLYQQEVSVWYRKRKEVYDETVISEHTTKTQKKKILERKQAIAQAERIRKAEQRVLQLAKLEEERIEHWIKQWEVKIVERGEVMRKKCRNCMIMPETPEDILLKKHLQKEIKAHIKEVLRNADKLKIPMEIPEAYQIATQEIIEQEVGAEMERAKQSMKEEADRLQEEERIKQIAAAEKLKAEQKRRKKWAIVTLQTHMRAYLSRHRTVQLAKVRYTKCFHPAYHEYYYTDNVTKRMFWHKPKSLGSYDVAMDDYWLIMHCYQEEHRNHTLVHAVGNNHSNNNNNGGEQQQQMVVYQTEDSQAVDGRDMQVGFYHGPAGTSTAEEAAAAGDDDPHHSTRYNNAAAAFHPVRLANTHIDVSEQQKLFYYYNPSTWQQTWEQPRGTILCDTCHCAFAKLYYKPTAHLHNHSNNIDQMYREDTYHFYYCEPCFQTFSTHLSTQFQIHPKEIMVQVFDGGSSVADYLDFHQIAYSNWYAYSTQIDASLKLSAAEEAALLQQEHDAKEARLKDVCRLCEYEACLVQCVECAMNFCKTCCRMEHKRKHKRYHTLYKMQRDGTLKLMVKKVREYDEEGHRVKQKKKKKKQQHDGDGTNKKKKTKKKKKEAEASPMLSAASSFKFPSLFRSNSSKPSDDTDKKPNTITTNTAAAASSEPLSLPPIAAKSTSFKGLPSLFSSASSFRGNPPPASTGHPETEDHQKEKKDKKKKKKQQKGDSEADSSATEDDGEQKKRKKKKKKKKKSADAAAGGEDSEVSDNYGADSELDGDASDPKKRNKKKKKKKKKAPSSSVEGTESSADDSMVSTDAEEEADRKRKKKAKKTAQTAPSNGATMQPLQQVPEGEEDDLSVAYESSDYHTNNDNNNTSGYYSSTDYATSAYNSTDYASDA